MERLPTDRRKREVTLETYLGGMFNGKNSLHDALLSAREISAVSGIYTSQFQFDFDDVRLGREWYKNITIKTTSFIYNDQIYVHEKLPSLGGNALQVKSGGWMTELETRYTFPRLHFFWYGSEKEGASDHMSIYIHTNENSGTSVVFNNWQMIVSGIEDKVPAGGSIVTTDNVNISVIMPPMFKKPLIIPFVIKPVCP